MKHFQVVQGSDEWKQLRLGIACASEMDRVITAKRWEPVSGEARRKYLVRLLTERILDCPLDDAVTPAMIHGNDYEKKTRAAYEHDLATTLSSSQWHQWQDFLRSVGEARRRAELFGEENSRSQPASSSFVT